MAASLEIVWSLLFTLPENASPVQMKVIVVSSDDFRERVSTD
jgi:hypothetical protein